jgi:hypothetical protein
MGKAYRLLFATTAAGVATALGGEKSFSWSHGSSNVDTTDKDGPSGIYVPGQISFSVNGNIKLPDAALELAFDACKSGDELFVTVKNGAIVKFHGAVSVGNFKGDFDSTAAAPYSFELLNSDVPLVDDLGATGGA